MQQPGHFDPTEVEEREQNESSPRRVTPIIARMIRSFEAAMRWSADSTTPSFGASRTKGLAWLLLWFGMVTINAEQHVASLNMTALQQLLIRNDKAVLSMPAGISSCRRGRWMRKPRSSR